MESEEIEFTVKCKMKKRWVPYFCSMLKTMQDFGSIGHTEVVGLVSDGDGDFRPKFSIDVPYEKVNPLELKEPLSLGYCKIYDAG